MGDIRKGESNEKLIIFHTTVYSQVMVSCVDSRSILHALAHRRAEGGKMLSVMVVRRGRVRGCRREADVLAEREIDAPNNSVCSTASKFDRADGSGCGASGESMQAAATRRTAAAKAQVTRWSRPRDRLAATKTRDGRCPEAQGCAKTVTGMPVLSKVPRLRGDGSTLYTC